MLTLNPRKRKDRPPRNKIAAILLSILWGISAIITGILDYKDIIDITDVVRLPIGYVILIFILLGSVAIYTLYSIYKLIKEIRECQAEIKSDLKYIREASERHNY